MVLRSQSVKLNELTFQLIIESIPNPVVLVNEEGKIAYANNKAEVLFDYTKDELIGELVELLIPKRFKEHHPKFRELFFKTPIVRAMGAGRELFAAKKDGTEFPIEIGLNPVVLIDNKLVLASIIDITERKKIESLIQNQLTELERANIELESFSYSVSHDLRAPLRAMNGYARMLKENYETKLDPEANRLMNNIIDNAKKMGLLIDELLTFSRLGRKELILTTISMNDLVTSICTDLKKEHEHRDIEFSIKQLLPAKADTTTIKQVWLNLISNAVKYSNLKDKAIIEIDSEIKENEIIYSIKDNGAGFDMRYADKLFGVFQRLHSDEEFEGTGVGLAIVKRIINKYGGRVWAESKVNEGATFFFTLNKI